jgi:hypothetical protein
MSLQRDLEEEDGGVVGAIRAASCSFVRSSSSAFTDPRIFPGGTTSTSLAPPSSAYLATDTDALVFADFASKGAETRVGSNLKWPKINVFNYKPCLRPQIRYGLPSTFAPDPFWILARPYTYDPHLFTRHVPFQK